LKVKFLLNSAIVVIKPHPPKSPPQCYTCQSYGHTQEKLFPWSTMCGMWGKPHLGFLYQATRFSSQMCFIDLCNGSHTTNYKGCPNYKNLNLLSGEILPYLTLLLKILLPEPLLVLINRLMLILRPPVKIILNFLRVLKPW